MFKGTTPTYIFNFSDELVNLEQASSVYVTFAKKDGQEIITKDSSGLVVSEKSVQVFLSQEETLNFPAGDILVQVNWLYNENGITKRACSKILSIVASRNLKNEVLS